MKASSRITRIVVAISLFVIIGAVGSAQASNLLTNGDFSSGTTGWSHTNASLAADSTTGAPAPSAKVTATANATYLIYQKAATTTSAGTIYTANGQFRSDVTPGKSICLRLREYASGGALVQAVQKCKTASTSWAALSQVVLTAKQSGGSVKLDVYQASGLVGQSFEVDTLDLEAGSGPPPPSVSALWHMDESPGATTMADSSGNGNNGTIQYGTSNPQNPTLGVPGFTGTGYSFNGSNLGGYVQVPAAADLNPGSANLTLTAHVNFTTLPGVDYDIIRKGLSTTAGGDYKMEILSSGYAHCWFRGSKGLGITKAVALNNGAWHTIKCIKTATSIQLVVDGTTKTAAATIGSIANASDVFVGAKPGDDFYNGVLDEVSIAVG